MATTYVDYTATAGQTDFAFNFPYLEDEHVTVEINGVAQLSSAFTIVTTPALKVVLNSGATAGQIVRVRRKSQPDTNLVDFVNGSVLTESELDRAYLHNRYLAEEISELNDASLQEEQGGTNWDAKNERIKNVGTPTATTDAVTKIYLDNKVAQVSSGATQPPLKWQFTGLAGANGTYTVTGAEVNGDTAYEVSIDGLIQEPGVDFTVNPNTDTLTIVPNISAGADIVVIQRGFGVAVTGTVGTNSLVDGSVTSDKISTTDTKFNVQSGGNVGIGTASPNISEGLSGTTVVTVSATNSSRNAVLELKGIRNMIGDPVGYLRVFNKEGTTPITDIQSIRGADADEDGGPYGKLLFRTSNADAMTIDEEGNVGIGTTSPAYALDVAGDLNITGNYKVNGTNLTTVPTGTVSAFAGSDAPTGYALCDGSEYSESTEAALFAVIGSTYNTGGETANHFRVPDLRGRVVAGFGERLLGATPDTLGEDNGLIANTKEHKLTAAQSGLRDHTHNVTAFGNGFKGGTDYVNITANPNTPTATGTDANEAHNNVQPTIILNYIIKT
jgi:microcystin-dependent protein